MLFNFSGTGGYSFISSSTYYFACAFQESDWSIIGLAFWIHGVTGLSITEKTSSSFKIFNEAYSAASGGYIAIGLG